MSDITTIVSSMGGFQAATPQDQAALEALLGSRGGRQQTGSAPIFTTPPSITGTPTVGQPLSALTFTDGVVSGGSITARSILLAGTPVAASYVLQAADVGKSVVYRNASGAVVSDSAGVAVVDATPTTITATDTAAGLSWAGAYDPSQPNRRGFMTDFPGQSFPQSLFVALINGTDADLALFKDGSSQPDGFMESAADRGPYTSRNASGGFYPLLVGQPQAERLVTARGGPGQFASLTMGTTGAAGLRVTGKNPSVRLYSDWLMGGNGDNRVRCAQYGILNPLGGNWRPARLPVGDGDATENIYAMLFRGDITDLVIASKNRWLGVSMGGGDTQYFDLGTNGITAIRIPVTAGMKDYVITSNTGAAGSILAAAVVQGPGGLTDVSARGAWDRWGDSITEGVEASSTTHTDLTMLAGWLGYAPGQHGIGGQTIQQIKSRMAADLPKRTINAASFAEWAGGRNNLVLSTDTFSAALLQDIRDSLQMLVDKGYRRVIARGQAPQRFPGADDQVRNIVAQMGGVVRFVETDGLNLQRPGEIHPNDEDYRRMAVGLRARYEAAIA